MNEGANRDLASHPVFVRRTDDASASQYRPIVELDSLRSQLISRTLDGEVALDLMLSAESIRALTEAEAVVSPELSIISRHDEIMALVMGSRDHVAL